MSGCESIKTMHLTHINSRLQFQNPNYILLFTVSSHQRIDKIWGIGQIWGILVVWGNELKCGQDFTFSIKQVD